MRLGRHEQAVAELELVRSLAPDDESMILHLAAALLALKKKRKARRLLVEHAELLIKVSDRDEIARLCDLLLAAGLPGIATDILENSIVGAPNDIGLLRRLAYARFDGGDNRGGDRVSRRLVRLDPGLTSSHENLVLSALESNRPGLARMRLNRALSRCPGDERLRRLRVLLVVRLIPTLWRGLSSRFTRKGRTGPTPNSG